VDPSRILGLFIAWPALALVPAAVFGFLYLRGRSRLVLAASLAWLAYVPYELGMKLRILCSGECNIRVDLLLLYPLLVMLSVVGLVVVARARRSRAR
jgi:DNA-binding PadR family transcriptional regulator